MFFSHTFFERQRPRECLQKQAKNEQKSNKKHDGAMHRRKPPPEGKFGTPSAYPLGFAMGQAVNDGKPKRDESTSERGRTCAGLGWLVVAFLALASRKAGFFEKKVHKNKYKLNFCTQSSILFLFTLFLSSCEEYTNWDLNLNAESRLVVEAILTDEFKTQEIRLSKSFNEFNGTPPPISDALIEVKTDGIGYNFIADASSPGLYKSTQPFAIISHLTYTLNIEWEGENYIASSKLSQVAPMPDIIFQADSTSDSLTFGNFVPTYHLIQQAMYEMEIDWSHLTNESPVRARMYFYTFSTLHVNEIIKPRREEVHFPRGSIVIAKKYGLNDDFAAYLKAMLIETDWSGNVFYAPSDNLPTNISNNAYGFFSTCAVVVDTVVAR